MPVINRIADFAEDMKAWRRWLHAHPELELDCHETAAFVVDRLGEIGVDEIHEGIGVSGVVAIIEGQGEGPTIGLRADMDALPMSEETGLGHASEIPGKMHACGHDGHTTMLLGAAKYLAETRRFSGRVALIFQPAEEKSSGAKVMCDEGMMERFDIAQVYALHNLPGYEFGHFATTPGPIMAAVDDYVIHIQGKGGHAAYPHGTRDPLIAAASIAQGLNAIVTRDLDPREDLIVAVTQIHGGSAHNIVPDTAMIAGTVRSFDPDVRDMAERRLREIVAGQAAAFGVSAEVEYERGDPPVVNHAREVALAAEVASDVVGETRVTTEYKREMGAEDFAHMLDARPGAYLFLGAGEGAGLHHPKYDFNDEISPIGASFFARLVETLQPV
ncbi:MAG: M20 family metallopeptidase [Maritimibacter sp.]